MPRPALAVLVVVAGLSACGAADSSTSVPPEPTIELRVLVAGDSITEGYYATEVADGFARLLVDAWSEKAEIEPVVVPVSGGRTWRVADAVRSTMEAEEPVGLAVLEVGANDVGKTTPAEWRQSYRKLLDATLDRSPGIDVVCLGPWNEPAASAPYEAVVEELCADHLYVPLSDLYAQADLHGPEGSQTHLGPRDQFHPNDAGHAAIAARVVEAVGLSRAG